MFNKEYPLGILCMKQKNRKHTCVFQFLKEEKRKREEEREREEGNRSKIGSEEEKKDIRIVLERP